jgi:hypothetical protein
MTEVDTYSAPTPPAAVGLAGAWRDIGERPVRALVRTLLRGTRHGTLTIVEGAEAATFGVPSPGAPAPRVTVHDRRFYRALLRGSLGVGDAYAEQWFDCDDLPELARLAALNMPALDRWRRGVRPLVALPQAAARWWERNTPQRARSQIAAHYDLGNDLFRLMLDETMMYSCAIFDATTTSLHEAQVAKLDVICRKLELREGDHVLEIGTGWGGFAIHAAANYGCRVTTTTISAAQHALAAERIRAAGLEHRITLLQQDYRDLEGSFDKLVSIEMIEAVGWQYFDTFFSRCASLLRTLLGAPLAARRDAAPGDHDRRAGLRGREGEAQLREHPRLPGRLPAVAQRDLALGSARHRPATDRARGPHVALRADAPLLARELPRPARPGPLARLRPPLPADLGALPRLLRGRVRRRAHRRRPAAAGEAPAPRRARRQRRVSVSGRSPQRVAGTAEDGTRRRRAAGA